MSNIEPSIQVYRPKSITIMVSPDAESIWFTFRTEGKHVDDRCTVYCNLKTYDGSDPKLPIIKVEELDKNYSSTILSDLTETFRDVLVNKSKAKWRMKYAKPAITK
jgi:hypothetical protein